MVTAPVFQVPAVFFGSDAELQRPTEQLFVSEDRASRVTQSEQSC